MDGNGSLPRVVRKVATDVKEWELRNNFLIPIYICCDSGVEEEEYLAGVEGIEAVVNLLKKPREIKSFGKQSWSQGEYSNGDYYLSKTQKRNNQFDGEGICMTMMSEPWQKFPNTHLDIFITSKDLFARGMNWIFGVTIPNVASSQSVYRFREESKQIKLSLIRRTLEHETGHLLGIPGPLGSHPRIYNKGGDHCSNVCVMRQGWSLAEFKSQMLEEKNRDIVFCQECIQELRLKQGLFQPL